MMSKQGTVAIQPLVSINMTLRMPVPLMAKPQYKPKDPDHTCLHNNLPLTPSIQLWNPPLKKPKETRGVEPVRASLTN
jgi:hypothetical protein